LAGPQRVAIMASTKPLNDYFKIVVAFEKRADGGLRAYSDDVPGFVLSHDDASALLKDVKPALEGILSDMFGTKIVVEQLARLRERLTDTNVVGGQPFVPSTCEYVSHQAPA
jgi:hypothetical protein